VTTFAGTKYGPAFWYQVRRDLQSGAHPSTHEAPNALATAQAMPSSAPMPIFLVPSFFWGGELPRSTDIETGLADYASTIDGAFYWGIAGVPGLGHTPDQIPSSDAYGTVLHHAGKLYMAPICFQFWGANAGRDYEYSGFSCMRAMWMHAIHVSHPEWVEIITWNDFIEGTYVSPIDDPAKYAHANDLGASIAPPETLHHFHTHRGATDLLAYYIQWYKTGVQPYLAHDSIFWAYRTQPLAQNKNTAAIKLYGPVQDSIGITANLTAPAVLRVAFGETSRSISLPAGSTDVQLPLPPADGHAPIFELMRGTSHLARATGDDPIAPQAPYPDLYDSTGSMHSE
jgi:glucan endo-1,3-alpha-glucosidase